MRVSLRYLGALELVAFGWYLGVLELVGYRCPRPSTRSARTMKLKLYALSCWAGAPGLQ